MEDNTQAYWEDVLGSLNTHDWEAPYNEPETHCPELLPPEPASPEYKPGSPIYRPGDRKDTPIDLTEEPPKKRQRKTADSRTWVFVLNNPKDEEVQKLTKFLESTEILYSVHH